MKRLILLFSFFIALIVVLLSGCNQSDPIIPEEPGGSEGVTQSITSSSGGTVSHDGFSLIVYAETVPRQTNGSEGTVVFSMNTSESLPSGLPSLPSGYTQIGKFLNAGPDNFNFNGPVRVTFSAGAESSPSNLNVLGYFPATNDWRIIPSYVVDPNNKTMAVDVLNLGWFVLVKSTSDNAFLPHGGFQYCINDGLTFIIVTIKSAVFEEPGIANFYPDGLAGRVFVSPNIPGTVFPSDKCRGIVPRGTYELWVSTRKFNETQIFTYSIPFTVTISNSLNFPLPWIYTDADGWTTFGCQPPAGGTWLPGRPQSWPPPTIPYGSGKLQATLTWLNSSGDAADLDLHLLGPNGIHISWQNTSTNDFKLDRDWRSQLGNAVENIYSLNNTIPSGNYSIKVHNFQGVTKSFNTRVVLNGTATNFTGTLPQSQETIVKTFNIP